MMRSLGICFSLGVLVGAGCGSSSSNAPDLGGVHDTSGSAKLDAAVSADTWLALDSAPIESAPPLDVPAPVDSALPGDAPLASDTVRLDTALDTIRDTRSPDAVGTVPDGSVGVDGAGGTAGTGSGGSSSSSGGTGGVATSTGGAAGAILDGGADRGAGDAGDAGAQYLGRLLGPVMDNEPPVTVGIEHSGFPLVSSFANQGVFVDRAGNVFVVGTTPTNSTPRLFKFAPSLSTTPIWSLNLDTLVAGVSETESSFSLAPDGGVFFSGTVGAALPGETFGGGFEDAVVGKLTADGTVAWIHQWGSSGSDIGFLTATLSDGSVVAAGTSSGQAPGNPSTVAGGPWIARYDANGARVWLKQYANLALGSFPVVSVDADDNIYLLGTASMLKVEAQQGSQLLIKTGPFESVTMNPTKDAMYSWAAFGSPPLSDALRALWKVDLGSLSPISYFETEPTRTAVIDAVENVIWTGSMVAALGNGLNGYQVLVDTSAVYLTGTYKNSYMNGSTARPTQYPTYVGRYDLSGNRVWFKEFLHGTTNTPSASIAIALDPSGNLVVVTGGVHAEGSYIVRLNAADGTLL